MCSLDLEKVWVCKIYAEDGHGKVNREAERSIHVLC